VAGAYAVNPPIHPDVTVLALAVVLENTADSRDCGPLRVELVYGRSDPYAVWFIIGESKDPPAWVVARDLVAAGCASPSGDGDVRIWPVGPQLVVRLESPEGRFVFALPRSQVDRFLTATFREVRQGREAVGLDVDEAIARMRPTGWVL
jgi:hypothetical protein